MSNKQILAVGCGLCGYIIVIALMVSSKVGQHEHIMPSATPASTIEDNDVLETPQGPSRRHSPTASTSEHAMEAPTMTDQVVEDDTLDNKTEKRSRPRRNRNPSHETDSDQDESNVEITVHGGPVRR